MIRDSGLRGPGFNPRTGPSTFAARIRVSVVLAHSDGACGVGVAQPVTVISAGLSAPRQRTEMTLDKYA